MRVSHAVSRKLALLLLLLPVGLLVGAAPSAAHRWEGSFETCERCREHCSRTSVTWITAWIKKWAKDLGTVECNYKGCSIGECWLKKVFTCQVNGKDTFRISYYYKHHTDDIDLMLEYHTKKLGWHAAKNAPLEIKRAYQTDELHQRLVKLIRRPCDCPCYVNPSPRGIENHVGGCRCQASGDGRSGALPCLLLLLIVGTVVRSRRIRRIRRVRRPRGDPGSCE